MGSGTFRGGIHPYDGKELSRDRVIQDIRPGKELAYLVSQHIGAPAKPIVKKGDRVLVGQMIAEAGGFVSAPVYASVSGVVKGIEKRLTATGGYCDAIIVENDEVYESVAFEETKDITQLSKDEIRGKIQKAGIVGMGGAGFPTHVKLSPKEPEKIKYILVNGAECEPYLTSDYRIMLEQPEKLVGGLKVMLQLFDGAKGYICIEDTNRRHRKTAGAGRRRSKYRSTAIKDKISTGCRAYADLCSDRRDNQFFHASGRCRMYRG